MFLATILVILLGAVSYTFFPAIGPFYYESSPSPVLEQAQTGMLAKYYHYKDTQEYLPYQLIQGIAAMPSLHVANAFVFVFFIFRYARPFSVIYIPSFIYIFIDAMYTKYHYFLDLVFGLILAAMCIYISYLIYEKRDKYLAKLKKA